MKKWIGLLFAVIFAAFSVKRAEAQEHSVARLWNEALLQAIREDFARPTIHARNLFHVSVAMYDAWAVFDGIARPYLAGNTVNGFSCPLFDLNPPEDLEAARQEAISYAAYRVLIQRFRYSPGAQVSVGRFVQLLHSLGYSISSLSSDYTTGSPAALGNYIGQCVLDYGLQDGSNEANGYAIQSYVPVNPPIAGALPGNPGLLFPNRWQPITFPLFIDQSGNVTEGTTPEFVSPEWGRVSPFALSRVDLSIYERDGTEYWVYHDPGPPPLLSETGTDLDDDYKWGFDLVANWSSHLDPSDGVLWDISPGSIGNIDSFPQTSEGFRTFYDRLNGGDPGTGHAFNPFTGQPYEKQVVPRGDYARVLAEFWADGPDSETPPGHWFTIVNYLNDHPDLVKRFRGEGPILGDLEWDVKSYFLLGGTMHDAAITAWGIKGWYDYVRPISAIRYMADNGQSTDPGLPNYSTEGIPLVDGLIEQVMSDDPLVGLGGEHLGKIKLYAWRGPDFIGDPAADAAGVGWILAENWWPYQRPTFITPPFAGYISGHSTYSRAAAEALTLLTGDPFFPGGMGVFEAPRNEFLVFEEGPSVDIVLQWATYRDASDQCSLSRIWGGIHPPADDIPGRIKGEILGVDAFLFAELYFNGVITSNETISLPKEVSVLSAYPNPVNRGDLIRLEFRQPAYHTILEAFNMLGQRIRIETVFGGTTATMNTDNFSPGVYIIRLSEEGSVPIHNMVVVQ